jgi:hypothetical protein
MAQHSATRGCETTVQRLAYSSAARCSKQQLEDRVRRVPDHSSTGQRYSKYSAGVLARAKSPWRVAKADYLQGTECRLDRIRRKP